MLKSIQKYTGPGWTNTLDYLQEIHLTNLENYLPALSCSGSDGHPLALVDPHRVVRRNCVLVKLALRARMIVCLLFVVPSRRLFKIQKLIEDLPALKLILTTNLCLFL